MHRYQKSSEYANQELYFERFYEQFALCFFCGLKLRMALDLNMLFWRGVE